MLKNRFFVALTGLLVAGIAFAAPSLAASCCADDAACCAKQEACCKH